MNGEVWAVPYMPREQWNDQPQAVWDAVYRALRDGWGSKVSDAHRLSCDNGFGIDVATKADELGAPVGQMFTVCTLRARQRPPAGPRHEEGERNGSSEFHDT